MDPFTTIVQFLVITTLAGIVATGGMTLFMTTLTRSGITNADMVRAIGGIFTKSEDEEALMLGSLLHLVSGISFAMVYTLVLVYFKVPQGLATVGGTMLLGAFHGFVLSFLLVIAVAENHPVSRFQDAGFGVAVAHFLGHILYGFLVGAVLTALDLHF